MKRLSDIAWYVDVVRRGIRDARPTAGPRGLKYILGIRQVFRKPYPGFRVYLLLVVPMTRLNTANTVTAS